LFGKPPTWGITSWSSSLSLSLLFSWCLGAGLKSKIVLAMSIVGCLLFSHLIIVGRGCCNYGCMWPSHSYLLGWCSTAWGAFSYLDWVSVMWKSMTWAGPEQI
jgi:hypothetical protein